MELSQQQRLIHVDHNRFAIFDRQLIVSRKRYKVETLCYNVIGKSYVAYRMMLPISYIPHLILLWLCCRLFIHLVTLFCSTSATNGKRGV